MTEKDSKKDKLEKLIQAARDEAEIVYPHYRKTRTVKGFESDVWVEQGSQQWQVFVSIGCDCGNCVLSVGASPIVRGEVTPQLVADYTRYAMVEAGKIQDKQRAEVLREIREALEGMDGKSLAQMIGVKVGKENVH